MRFLTVLFILLLFSGCSFSINNEISISANEIIQGQQSNSVTLFEFIEQESFTYLFDLGLFTGFALILLIYSFLVYVNVRHLLFFWFFVYTFLVTIYLFLTDGWIINLNSGGLKYFNIINSGLILYAFKSFFQWILKMKEYFKETHRWMNYGVVLGGVAVVIQLFFPESIVLLFITRLIFASVIGMVLICVLKQHNDSPIEKVLLRISIISLVFAGVSFTLNSMEIFDTINVLLVGVIFMVLHILSYSMSVLYRVKKLGDRNESLWKDIRQTKNQLFEVYFDGVKEEKVRIMSELQSSVLKEISEISSLIQKNNSELALQLDAFSNDIVLVSEELNPDKENSQPQLVKNVQNLVNNHQSDDIKYKVIHFGEIGYLTADVEKHLFRIVQEAIQNIEKYAKASEVEIQILRSEDQFILSIDDNGQGFDMKKKPKGIGILNMRNRVAEIGGTFNITSSIGNGVSIIITLNNTNEKEV